MPKVSRQELQWLELKWLFLGAFFVGVVAAYAVAVAFVSAHVFLRRTS